MNRLVVQACKQFTNTSIREISALGSGLINDTYLVKTESEIFVLQRINAQVFPEPGLVMENMMLLNQHIQQANSGEIKLIIPEVIRPINQGCYIVDQENNYWRALAFIGDTVSKESISNLHEAEQVGFALAHFHRLLCDVGSNSFHDTLPGFHITPTYFQYYQQIEKQKGSLFEGIKVQFARTFIDDFQSEINILEDARQEGLLIDRIIHGDPKLNNFLFDQQTHKIISLIDLDTVKPGLVHYDIADCLRSCCHNKQTNTFDLKKCSAILNSYLREAGIFFTRHDYQFLYPEFN
jgi:Ser/Thr protein kinase RdoA (MazF antagonist)